MSGPIMTLREIMEAEETPLDIDIAEDMEREFSPNGKDTTMDGYQNAKLTQQYNPNKSTQERPSIADALDAAVSALSDASRELSGITDRLCGSTPEPIDANKLHPVADGHFSQVDMSREGIVAITENIIDNVRRIRGRL